VIAENIQIVWNVEKNLDVDGVLIDKHVKQHQLVLVHSLLIPVQIALPTKIVKVVFLKQIANGALNLFHKDVLHLQTAQLEQEQKLVPLFAYLMQIAIVALVKLDVDGVKAKRDVLDLIPLIQVVKSWLTLAQIKLNHFLGHLLLEECFL
jgi:hypothetical protein